jgi:hypothetical protein
MKIIITEEQYNSLNEMIKLDIKVGDTLMGGGNLRIRRLSLKPLVRMTRETLPLTVNLC